MSASTGRRQGQKACPPNGVLPHSRCLSGPLPSQTAASKATSGLSGWRAYASAVARSSACNGSKAQEAGARSLVRSSFQRLHRFPLRAISMSSGVGSRSTLVPSRYVRSTKRSCRPVGRTRIVTARRSFSLSRRKDSSAPASWARSSTKLIASPTGRAYQSRCRAQAQQYSRQTLGQVAQKVSPPWACPPWASEGSVDVNNRRVSLLRVSRFGMNFFFMASPLLPIVTA